MKRSLLIGSIVLAFALTEVGLAQASPATENVWAADVLMKVNGTMDARSVQMSASGKGIYFYGGEYRDYDAATNTWGNWQRLARNPKYLMSDGNARGDVCATWWADFGVAAACRIQGSSTWVKKNLYAGRGASGTTVDVSADGTSAMFTWWSPTGRRGKAILNAGIYTFASGTWSRPQVVSIRNDRGKLVSILSQGISTPAGAGYVLAYVTGKKGRRNVLIPEATFQQVWTPGSGWGRQGEILLAPPGGTPAPVAMAALAGDGTVTAAAFSHQPPANQDLPQHDWWIATTDAAGTFVNPVPAGAVTFGPRLSVCGQQITLAGKDYVNDYVGALELSVLNGGSVLRHRIDMPDMFGVPGHNYGFGITPQTMTDGACGFAIVVEVDGIQDRGEEWEEDVQEAYTSVGYVDAVGALQVSALSRLGTTRAYDGMNPGIAGWGQYALIDYTDQTDAFAAIRKP